MTTVPEISIRSKTLGLERIIHNKRRCTQKHTDRRRYKDRLIIIYKIKEQRHGLLSGNASMNQCKRTHKYQKSQKHTYNLTPEWVTSIWINKITNVYVSVRKFLVQVTNVSLERKYVITLNLQISHSSAIILFVC